VDSRQVGGSFIFNSDGLPGYKFPVTNLYFARLGGEGRAVYVWDFNQC
jgi:hypothetical protein